MKTSVGIICYRFNQDNEIEFFVGHPGGPFWSKKNFWMFFKGQVEETDTTLLSTAIREFNEETGVDLNNVNEDNFHYLGKITQRSNKRVHAYCVEHDIDISSCCSNLTTIEYPLKSGIMIEVPEIDSYCWMTFDELKNKTLNAHLPFYEKVTEKVVSRCK